MNAMTVSRVIAGFEYVVFLSSQDCQLHDLVDG